MIRGINQLGWPASLAGVLVVVLSACSSGSSPNSARHFHLVNDTPATATVAVCRQAGGAGSGPRWCTSPVLMRTLDPGASVDLAGGCATFGCQPSSLVIRRSGQPEQCMTLYPVPAPVVDLSVNNLGGDGCPVAIGFGLQGIRLTPVKPKHH